MKRKVLSFVLACIFCLSVMSMGVFAHDDSEIMPLATYTCPDHPDAGWGVKWATTPSGKYIHYYTCDVCGFEFDWDECNFYTGNGDCTVYSSCIICDRPNPVQYNAHEFSGAWSGSTYFSYHYRTCIHPNCYVEEHEAHNRDWTVVVDGKTRHQCSVCHVIHKD